MATINIAGEILTVADDQQDDNRNGSKKQYVHYSRGDKKTTVVIPRVLNHAKQDNRKRIKVDIDGVPFESDDSEYDCSSDDSENDDYGYQIQQPISPPSSPRVQSDEGFEVGITTSFGSQKSAEREADPFTISETTTILQSISSKESKDGAINESADRVPISEPTSIRQSISSRKSEGSAMTESVDPVPVQETPIRQSISSRKRDGSFIDESVEPVPFQETPIRQSISSRKSEGSAISEATPIVLRDPTPAVSRRSTSMHGSRLSALTEASAINFNDSAISQNLESDKDEGSVYSEASLKDIPEPINKSSNHSNSKSRKGRISVMSEATPIQFFEPGERDQSVSLRSRKSAGSELSETTPIKFYESTADIDFDWESDSSHNSNATPAKLGESRRELGMTFLERKASQRLQSEMLDNAIDQDAERDIVNVYLEASAFADRERINLTEDIYSFVLACSYCSLEFWTAIYFILVKYLCYGVIFMNLYTKSSYEGEGQEPNVLATKLIMVPVTVAMQEDLITVYYNAANKKYDALTIKGNIYATETKWILSNLLRAIDGIMSLAVNFGVMLLGIDLLNIFLSFAALHFLQFIDDVIYELAEKGFFGQKLEQATIACKIITFTRRTSAGDPCNNFITQLDTILLFGSMVVCYIIYAYFLIKFYSDEDNTLFERNEVAGMEADMP